eukprot:gene11852-biopygen3383
MGAAPVFSLHPQGVVCASQARRRARRPPQPAAAAAPAGGGMGWRAGRSAPGAATRRWRYQRRWERSHMARGSTFCASVRTLRRCRGLLPQPARAPVLHWDKRLRTRPCAADPCAADTYASADVPPCLLPPPPSASTPQHRIDITTNIGRNAITGASMGGDSSAPPSMPVWSSFTVGAACCSRRTGPQAERIHPWPFPFAPVRRGCHTSRSGSRLFLKKKQPRRFLQRLLAAPSSLGPVAFSSLPATGA